MSFSIEELRKRSAMNLGTQKQQISTTPTTTTLNTLKKLNSDISKSTKNKNILEEKVNTVSSSIIKETSKVYHEQKIELVFLFDKSGSCHGTEQATCNYYDHLIMREKKENLPIITTTVLFDGSQQEIAFRKNISQVSSLKYQADGDSTAIYDTMSNYIKKVMNAQDNEVNPPKKTIVAIMTDGKDNDSHFYNDSDTRKLVEMAKSRGWIFIFLGAMQDAYDVGTSLGIHPDNIARIGMSDEAMQANFKAIEDAIDLVRKNGKIDISWKNNIQSMALEDKEQAKRLRLDMK